LLVAYFAVDLSSAAITSSPKAIMRWGCTSSSTHWTTSVLLYVGRRDIALCRSRGGGPVVTGARNATAFDSPPSGSSSRRSRSSSFGGDRDRDICASRRWRFRCWSPTVCWPCNLFK